MYWLKGWIELADIKKDMDMTNGPMWKNILLFAIPLALTTLVQQLFHSVDMAVVGRFCGDSELAAVGSNNSIINLLVNMFVGFSAGSNVVIGQLLGGNKIKTAKKAMYTSLVIAVVSGTLVMLLGIFISPILLKLISSPPDVIGLATIYLRIYFLGIPFLMIYNFSAAILRSRGETKKPFFCLATGGIVNTTLNLILVLVFDMGVSGVAIATTISNFISCVLILKILTSDKGPLGIKLKEIRIDKFILSRIIKIGLPMTIQSCLFPLSNMVVQSAVNSLGTSFIAANAAACSIEAFNYSVEGSFANACIAFVSQNYGARKLHRCKKAVRECTILGLLVVCAFSVLMCIFLPYILALFTKDATVVEIASKRLIFMYLSLPIAVIMDQMTYAIRGLGYSTIPTIVAIAGVCGFRILWISTVFNSLKSFMSILAVYPISWAIVFIILFPCYRIILKKVAKKLGDQQ